MTGERSTHDKTWLVGTEGYLRMSWSLIGKVLRTNSLQRWVSTVKLTNSQLMCLEDFLQNSTISSLCR